MTATPAWSVEPSAKLAPAASAASAPLTFRPNDPVEFPVGGAALLALLLVVAALSWRFRRTSSARTWLITLGQRQPAPSAVLRVETSLRLDPQTRLHVVHWNGRELLIAVGGPSSPVVLDRTEASPQPTEPTP